MISEPSGVNAAVRLLSRLIGYRILKLLECYFRFPKWFRNS